jgi:hypothetical protein
MIELMKLDKDFTDYHEGVDMSVTLEVRESYDAAPERFLPRLIAERAKLFCRKKMGIELEKMARYLASFHWIELSVRRHSDSAGYTLDILLC